MQQNNCWSWLIAWKSIGWKRIRIRISWLLEIRSSSTGRNTGGSQFNNPFLGCMTYQPCDVMNFELVHHLLTMLFNRLDAQTKFSSDLFIGKTFGNQLQHFSFSWG